MSGIGREGREGGLGGGRGRNRKKEGERESEREKRPGRGLKCLPMVPDEIHMLHVSLWCINPSSFLLPAEVAVFPILLE